jgi:hypothetical protein
MIKKVLVTIALLGVVAACNSPAATTSPTTPALESQAPTLESPSMPAESPTMEESASPSSS